MHMNINCNNVLSVNPLRILKDCLIIAALISNVFSQSERVVSTVDYIPVSGLCKRNTSEESCSHQGSPFVRKEACMVYTLNKESQSCSDESFVGDTDEHSKWSSFSMSTYLYREKGVHIIPCFNVSFSDIKWVNMKMRFKELYSPHVALCREFKVHPDLVDKLFFDCLWDRGDYQNKPFTFEYQIITGAGDTYLYKYLFKVPDSDHMWSSDQYDEVNINETKVFSMVDLSNQASQLSLIVETLPPSLNVTIYKIKMMFVASDKISNKTVEFKKILDNPSSPSFTYVYSEKLYPGYYLFSVTFEHPLCGQRCSVSTTPKVYFKETGRNTFEIILGVLILTSLCIISYFLIKIKSKKSFAVPSMDIAPKVLFIYNPVSKKHVKTMKNLAKFFKNNFHLDVMIDILELENQNPVEWYIKAFSESNFVCVFSSPKSDSVELENVAKSLIFPNTYSFASKQLTNALLLSKCKFLRIALPDTSWDTLPDVARRFQRFKLPQDLNSLLKTMKVMPQSNLVKELKMLLSDSDTILDKPPIIIECKPKIILEDKISPVSSRSASPIPLRNQCTHCKQSDFFTCEDEPLNPVNDPSPLSSRSSSPDCFI